LEVLKDEPFKAVAEVAIVAGVITELGEDFVKRDLHAAILHRRQNPRKCERHLSFA
jgi:hypothetical protein